jgi:predicted Zn-ribbon and HTH transcriptional regulator
MEGEGLAMVTLKCRKCKYEWDYQGSNPYYATCPRCLLKVPVGGYKSKGKN